jgi:hypothetical protein
MDPTQDPDEDYPFDLNEDPAEWERYFEDEFDYDFYSY